MSTFASWGRFCLYISAFAIVCIIINALLESNAAFRELYESMADCMMFSGSSHNVLPIVRALVVGSLAIGFLSVQRVFPWSIRGIATLETGQATDSVEVAQASQSRPARRRNRTANTGNVHASENPQEEAMNVPGHIPVEEDANVPAPAPAPSSPPPDLLLSARDANVYRLLGREAFIESRRRIVQQVGRFPPLDTFPILDASTLRPYHRFSDPLLYDSDLLSLVRPAYVGIERIVGSEAFFLELDGLLDALNDNNDETPFQVASQRHPTLTHSHPYMDRMDSVPHAASMVSIHIKAMKRIRAAYNALHSEQRDLACKLIYLTGNLDQAATYGGLRKCIRCLDLIDNVVTSLRGLIELEYTVRENVRTAGIV